MFGFYKPAVVYFSFDWTYALLGSTYSTLGTYFDNLRMEERCPELRNGALRYEKPFSK